MPELHLSLLGGLEIGAEAAGPPLARKARAMLAYLAMHAGQPQSREKLAALFWGRNGDSQARTNLRQALSALRRALPSGNGAHLVTTGDRVALDLDGSGLDVARFEALAAGTQPEQLEQAAALYRGDLLDGFSLREEAFEEWAGAERERLRLVAVGALEKLIAHYCDAQQFGRCAQAALRLLALDPLREDIHRALMRAYAAQSRVGLALKQYETCRDILRRELGVEPEPETRALVNELRARRGRSNGSEPDGPATACRSAFDAGTDPEAEGLDTTDLQPPIAAGPPLPEKPSVAVLGFENGGGDPDQAYFAEGITENIITGLTRFRDLFVIGLKSSLLARDKTADVREIGRQLGVAHVVEGSIRRVDDRVRITVQLIDAATAQRVWAEQYDRIFEDIATVEDEITDVIVATLAGRIEDASRLCAARKPVRDMVAYDYLLRARQHMRRYTKPDELAARSCLKRALELDAEYAAAHTALAYSFIHEYESTWCDAPREAAERAYGLAQQAVALDETDSTAHRALAYAALYCDLWDLASREIERAIALNSNDYPNLCVKAWILLFGGESEAALGCLNVALRLNPFAPDNCYLSIGVAQYTARRYAEAAQTFGRMAGWNTLRYAGLAACHGQLGQGSEARAAAARHVEAVKTEFAGETVDQIAHWAAYMNCILHFRVTEDREHLRDGLRKAGLSV